MPFYCSADGLNVKKKLFLLDMAGLALEKELIPKANLPDIGQAKEYLIPYWDIPKALLDSGVQFISDNPTVIPGLLVPTILIIDRIHNYFKNKENITDKEREGLYPNFLELDNKRHLSNEEFRKIANKQGKTSFLLDEDSIRITNDRIREAIKNKEELHVYRVLYRVQEEQLSILRSYDNAKNNLYFTDFEDYVLYRLSVDEAKTARQYYDANIDLRDKIKVGKSAYFPNVDAYYMIQLVDQACSLWVLKDMKNAKLWAVKGNPTLRCTCFGSVNDPSEFHLIAYKRGHPGASGRFLKANEWGNFLSDEDKINSPEEVGDKKEKAKTLIDGHLEKHFNAIVYQYSDIVSKDSFRNLREFVSKIKTWTGDQVLSFIIGKENQVHVTRDGVIKELSRIVNATLEPRVIKNC